MPIYHGLTQVNKKEIIHNGKQISKVYVGDKLVWQKMFPEVDFDLIDLFPSLMSIVNEEMDCYSEGTPITITSIDTVNKTVGVSWLPDETKTKISITNPIVNKEWVLGIGLGVEPSTEYQQCAFVKISSGDRNTKILNYSGLNLNVDSFIVGAKAYFYNVYNNGWDFVSRVLVAPNTYYARMTGPGGIYKHSDGTFRMVVNGYGLDLIWRVGLFSSMDLKNWVALSPVAKISSNGNDWTMDSLHISSIIKHPTENKYFGVGYGQSNGGYFKVGWVKFDEDMNNIEFSENEIIPSIGTNSGVYNPSIIYYNNKYRLFACIRNQYLSIHEYSADVPEGPYTFERVMIDGSLESLATVKTIYRNFSTMTFPFILNNKLYSIIDGTAIWNQASNKGLRQFGIFGYDVNTQKWVDINKGLVIGTFIEAFRAWGLSANGHSGGSPILYQNDDTMYFYAAQTVSSDDYQIYGLSKRVLKITKNLKGTISTNPPSSNVVLTKLVDTTIKQSLLSCWEFNELNGNIAYDSHGTNHFNHGMVINQDGKLNKSYKGTKAAGEFINGIISDSGFGAGESFTISIWLKLIAYDRNAYLISKRDINNDGKGFAVWYETDNGYTATNGVSRYKAFNAMFDFGTPNFILSTGPNSVTDLNWHHLIIYRRGTTIGIKLDGGVSSEYTHTNVGTSMVNTAPFSILKNMINNILGSAYIDQVALWNKALTEQEMTQLNNSNMGLAYNAW